MVKKDKMSIAARIKQVRENNLKLSKKELSEILGISQSAVNQWEKGVNLPANKHLIKLSQLASISIEWLLHGGKESNSAINIKYYPKIESSAGCGFENDKEDFFLISNDLIPFNDGVNKHTIALNVRGDSMEPVISEGGIVLIDTLDKNIKDGKIYVFRQQETLRLKRFEYSTSHIIIKSYNPAYQDEKVSFQEFYSSSDVIGRVIYSINKL